MSKPGRKIKGNLYKHGKYWYARWTAFGKKNARSTGIPCNVKGSKAKAEEEMAKLLAPYKAEEEADVRAALVERQRSAEAAWEEARAAAIAEASKIRLADAWELHPYVRSQPNSRRKTVRDLSPRNIRENECAWEKFVRWATAKHGKELAMQDVTEDMAKDYAKFLKGQRLTPSRRNKLILTCRVMYRIAGLDVNPFDAVEREDAQEAEHREPFTKEQVAKMLAEASGEWRGFLAVCYYTGLRAGDAAMLTHESRRDGRFHVEMAKTGSRVEPGVHPELDKILTEVAPAKKRGFLFPGLAEDYRRNPSILSSRFQAFAGRVLGEVEEGEDGGPVLHRFDGTAERKKGVRRISRWGLHSFRHSFASHAARAGIPIGEVQAWLGHTSAEITRTYVHYGTAEEQSRIMAAVTLEDAEVPTPATPPAIPAELAAILANASPEMIQKIMAIAKGN